ncbi:MAG: SH3 domain-containing protein [bacterium]|nr:SH3 domain-containing protein [bacterium]
MIDRLSHLVPVLLALTAMAAAPAAAAEEDLLDTLKAQTVMITVDRADQATEFGSGVVLCQDEQQVFVLTAHHVLAGKSPEGSGRKTLRLRKIKAKVMFYGGDTEVGFDGRTKVMSYGDQEVGRDKFVVHQVPGDDLLLLEFPIVPVLPTKTTLEAPARVADGTLQEDGPEVISVGYWKDQSEAWANRPGNLLAGGGKLVHHSGQIAEGFSGGPLFNRAGSLVGINIQRVRGEEIGARIGDFYGKALVVEEVLPAIDKWIPSDCLRSAGPLSNLAYLTYRKAMRAVSIKRWQDAKDLMSEALEHESEEGASVHLEGLRYTPYLPLYHRGLASYKLAARTSGYEASLSYSAAIRDWERAETKREIQKNKRYKTLKRLKARSYKALQRLSAPKTPEEEKAWAQARAEAEAEEKRRLEAKEREEKAKQAKLEERNRKEKERAEKERIARQKEIDERVATKVAEREKAEKARLEAQAAAEARAALRRVSETVKPCARLRAEPSRRGKRLDCLEPGTEASLLDQRDDWSLIRLEDGREGWMASRLLERVDTLEKD